MYKLLISKQVSKFILSRTKKEKLIILQKIELLKDNPLNPELDIKK